jgi:hypothetical protein
MQNMTLTAKEVEDGWSKRIQNNYASGTYTDVVWIPAVFLGLWLCLARFALPQVLAAVLIAVGLILFSIHCSRRWQVWHGRPAEGRKAQQREIILLTIAHLGLLILSIVVAIYLIAIQIVLEFLGDFVLPLVTAMLIISAATAIIVFAKVERLTSHLFTHIVGRGVEWNRYTKTLAILPGVVGIFVPILLLLLRLLFKFNLPALFVVVFDSFGAMILLAVSVMVFYQFALVLQAAE